MAVEAVPKTRGHSLKEVEGVQQLEAAAEQALKLREVVVVLEEVVQAMMKKSLALEE